MLALSVIKRNVFESISMIIEVPISPFNFVKLVLPSLRLCHLTHTNWNSYIFLVNLILSSWNLPSTFILKSALSDINIATLPFFFFLVNWHSIIITVILKSMSWILIIWITCQSFYFAYCFRLVFCNLVFSPGIFLLGNLSFLSWNTRHCAW